jgi:hypothetical protein
MSDGYPTLRQGLIALSYIALGAAIVYFIVWLVG